MVVNETGKRALWSRIMTAEVVSLAHETYAQDIVIVGYGWVSGSSNFPVEDERLAPPISP